MMLYNVLLQTPTSLVPMKKYLLSGGKKGKMGDQGYMLVCCVGCLAVSFCVKNLVDLVNFINLFVTPVLNLIVPVVIKIVIE
jgi:hypothetical protein